MTKGMWNGIDRRKFPRVEYRCNIVINTNSGEKSISTKTENIGSGGVCVLLDDDLGLFQGVALEIFENELAQPIRSRGTVVWVVKKQENPRATEHIYDTGIEFVDMEFGDRERLIKLVNVAVKNKGTI